MDAVVDNYESCFAAFGLDRCQYVLEHPHDDETYLLLPLIDARVVAPTLLRCVETHKGSINLKDTRVLSLLKKLMAYSIVTFQSSFDNQGKLNFTFHD